MEGNNNTELVDNTQLTSDSINYKSILFLQINFVRRLRCTDLGEFAVKIKFRNIINDEILYRWTKNIQQYQGGVKMLVSLLKPYHSNEFINNIKKIKNVYTDKRKKELEDWIKNNYNVTKFKEKKARQEFMIELKYAAKEYDDIFEECLILMRQEGFIGGYELTIDEN